jgi:hypothetical protein
VYRINQSRALQAWQSANETQLPDGHAWFPHSPLAREAGEAEPPDYSNNLLVPLGVVTEPLNRRWFEQTTGQVLKDVQTWMRHPVVRWMAAILDGVVEATGAVFEAKFMLPWSFSEEAAAEKHMPQLQHNM